MTTITAPNAAVMIRLSFGSIGKAAKNGMAAAAIIVTIFKTLKYLLRDVLLRSYQLIWSSRRSSVGSLVSGGDTAMWQCPLRLPGDVRIQEKALPLLRC